MDSEGEVWYQTEMAADLHKIQDQICFQVLWKRWGSDRLVYGRWGKYKTSYTSERLEKPNRENDGCQQTKSNESGLLKENGVKTVLGASEDRQKL